MDELHKVLDANNGIVTTAELRELNFDSRSIKSLVEGSIIEKVIRGIYIGVEYFVDNLFITQLQCTKGVYSLETALFYHGLVNRVPFKYDITIPSNYNTRLLKNPTYKFHYLKRDLYEIGIIELKTEFGNRIKVYDLERTICDIIRDKDSVEKNLFVEALKNYANSSERDTGKLYKYAKLFKIEETVKMYMEVLV